MQEVVGLHAGKFHGVLEDLAEVGGGVVRVFQRTAVHNEAVPGDVQPLPRERSQVNLFGVQNQDVTMRVPVSRVPASFHFVAAHVSLDFPEFRDFPLASPEIPDSLVYRLHALPEVFKPFKQVRTVLDGESQQRGREALVDGLEIQEAFEVDPDGSRPSPDRAERAKEVLLAEVSLGKSDLPDRVVVVKKKVVPA